MDPGIKCNEGLTLQLLLIPVTIHSRFEGSYQNMLTDLLINAMHRVVATTKYKRNVYYMKRLVEIVISTAFLN